MKEIAASILAANLLEIGSEIRKCESWGINILHLDHMDGHFVPNVAFGPQFVQAIRNHTRLFLDVHLMFSNPEKYLNQFIEAGSDRITIHEEIKDDPLDLIKYLHKKRISTGISIRPQTAPEKLMRFLPFVDQILLMTVEPGFGGQSIIPDCVDKILIIKEMIRNVKREILVEADGGIKPDNMVLLAEKGVDILVMGTGLFENENPRKLVNSIHLL